MTMTNFLYLFRGGDAPTTPQAMQEEMQKWIGWMKELGQKGHFKSGEPLEKEGKVLRGKNKAITDGPYPEAKDVVGGYLIVTAETLDHAAQLAKGCPIFDNGGTVEVRQIRPM
jgi:hypothetical protein